MFEVDGMTLEQQEKYFKNSVLSPNVQEFVSNTTTTTVQNETINLERELKLVKAKIRDAEFKIARLLIEMKFLDARIQIG